MYITSLEIKNIRAIENFKMDFPNPAGWHVLLGNNGAGKSSILKTISAALIGPKEIEGIRPNWNNWLRLNTQEGSIKMGIIKHKGIDKQGGISGVGSNFDFQMVWKRSKNNGIELKVEGTTSAARNSIWGGKAGWFSAGFGAFRRFSGGSDEMKNLYSNPSYTRLAAHLTVFSEDVDLRESIKWLQNLQFKSLEKSENDSHLLNNLISFINGGGLLPPNVKLSRINSEDVFLLDSDGQEISINQMSDGYRSALSLVFEMIRLMVLTYDEKPFKNHLNYVDITGVVLIDEIDAHLHPTWQTEIGKWFTKCFPNIQFIVTTHSPLVCRACDKGSIWRLATLGTDQSSGEITGTERDRLIYGNILEAYGTELFGQSPVRSEQSNEKLERLGELNMLSAFGKISEAGEKERTELQKILSTDAPTGF